MSLLIIKEPQPERAKKAAQLELGKWFLDADDNLYVIALDDQTLEKRVVYLGTDYKPFILKSSARDIKITRILNAGTVLCIQNMPSAEGTCKNDQ